MTRAQRLQDTLGWGLALWLAGYLLGIVLFFVVPPSLIGWAITPIGVVLTLVALSRVRAATATDFIVIAVVWTAVAVIGDYLFIVRLFQPADGYYKADVYVYYAATCALPLIVGWWRHPGRA